MATIPAYQGISPQEYKRRIWAWTMYDWANSAFATTILASILPVYFSQVAGSTLPSTNVATTYWSTGLSLSLFIVAVLSPILGTISDIKRSKKPLLSIFAGIGVVSTALLVLVGSGDWILASILAILGRVGFNGSLTFYDALLPHVAREEDQDAVSARGYALGYLGGGLLLVINVLMLQLLPGTWGPRISFVSVAIWWAVFTIPLLRHVPEPPSAAARLAPGENVLTASFKRLGQTIKDISRYRDLFMFLIAFLIYNDGIGTIIGLAAIYGAELGFQAVELILALLLVQFVGIPYSLIFGRLPKAGDKRRPFFLAFIIFNMVTLPLAGVISARLLPAEIIGATPAPFVGSANSAGQGVYASDSIYAQYAGTWQTVDAPAEEAGTELDLRMAVSNRPDARMNFAYNGQNIKITYLQSPDSGIWAVFLDGQPAVDPDTNAPLTIDAYNATLRYDASRVIVVPQPGLHILTLVNTGERNPDSQGASMTIVQTEVLPGTRQSNLLLILGFILVLEIIGLGLSYLFGPLLFSGLAEKMDTKRSILLALLMYTLFAIWGYFLNALVEFWFMAWMAAVVQGGSQALSRSLYSAMSPASKSGEFFGLFSIMEKFSSIIGPLLFVAAGLLFGSSRPAVLSLVLLFMVGGYLLSRVDVEAGKRVARAEDSQALSIQN